MKVSPPDGFTIETDEDGFFFANSVSEPPEVADELSNEALPDAELFDEELSEVELTSEPDDCVTQELRPPSALSVAISTIPETPRPFSS